MTHIYILCNTPQRFLVFDYFEKHKLICYLYEQHNLLPIKFSSYEISNKILLGDFVYIHFGCYQHAECIKLPF